MDTSGFSFHNQQNIQINSRWRQHLESDLRIVLRWDCDLVNVELLVSEPNDYQCSPFKNHTSNGGMLSKDMTGGYGPVEYSIKSAKSGNYEVKVRVRSANIGDGVHVAVTLYTNFGRQTEKERTFVRCITSSNEIVTLATIEIT